MLDARREKDRVLTQAAKLFGRFGYDAVSLEDVGRIAKVDRAAMGKLCFSKEDLFFQILSREVTLLVQQAEDAFEDSVHVPDALIRRLAHDAFDLAEQRPLIRGLMVGRFDDQLAHWRDRLHELRLRCLAIPEKVLRLGIGARLLRRDLPVELTAQLLLELHVMGYVYTGDQAARDFAERRRQVTQEIILRGLKHPSLPPVAPPPPTPEETAAAMKLGGPTWSAPDGTGEHWAPNFAASPRERMLDAAVRVARTEGLPAVSVESACSTAGGLMPPEDLLTREALLLAVLERDVAHVISEVSAERERQQGNAMELFRAMSRRSFEAMNARPLLLALVTGAASEALPQDEARLGEMLTRMADVLEPVVTLGQQQNLFRGDLPSDVVARILLELHLAGHLLGARPGPDTRLRALQRRLAALDLIFRGIASPSAG